MPSPFVLEETRRSFARRSAERADPSCVETVELSLGEYETIRTSPVRFPVKPGHDYPEFERVVDENDRYAVVEKFGEAAEVVRRLDPRNA
jgi:hypothetical protein